MTSKHLIFLSNDGNSDHGWQGNIVEQFQRSKYPAFTGFQLSTKNQSSRVKALELVRKYAEKLGLTCDEDHEIWLSQVELHDREEE